MLLVDGCTIQTTHAAIMWYSPAAKCTYTCEDGDSARNNGRWLISTKERNDGWLIVRACLSVYWLVYWLVWCGLFFWSTDWGFWDTWESEAQTNQCYCMGITIKAGYWSEFSLFSTEKSSKDHWRVNDGNLPKSTGRLRQVSPGRFGGFHKWGYPQIDGFFHGKSN